MFRNWRALLIYDKKCLHLQNSWVLLTCAAAAKSLQLCPTLCDPIRWQPTRLPRPWDSPGKNTGVGCHFLLQWMKVKSESEVAQSCPTLWDSMNYSLPGSSVHGIFQARVLEWGAIAFSVDSHGLPWNLVMQPMRFLSGHVCQHHSPIPQNIMN